jgi:flavodoxin
MAWRLRHTEECIIAAALRHVIDSGNAERIAAIAAENVGEDVSAEDIESLEKRIGSVADWYSNKQSLPHVDSK